MAGRADQVVGRQDGGLRGQWRGSLATAVLLLLLTAADGHVQLLEARQRLDVLVVVDDRVDAVEWLPDLVVLLLRGRGEVLPREGIDEQRVLLEVAAALLLRVVAAVDVVDMVGVVEVDVVLGRRLVAVLVVVLGVVDLLVGVTVDVVGWLPLARGEAQNRPHGGCEAADGAVRVARGQGLAGCQALGAAAIAISPLCLYQVVLLNEDRYKLETVANGNGSQNGISKAFVFNLYATTTLSDV